MVGACTRALVALRLGFHPVPAPDWLMAAAEGGKRAEAWYVNQVRRAGRLAYAGQAEIRLRVLPDLCITGHIDGVELMADGPYLLEIKSMSRRRYSTWLWGGFGSFPKYQAQITVYGHVIRLPVKYVVINRDSWSEYGQCYKEVDICYLPPYPYPIQPILERIGQVEEYARFKTLPGCDETVDYCNMGEICQRSGYTWDTKLVRQ